MSTVSNGVNRHFPRGRGFDWIVDRMTQPYAPVSYSTSPATRLNNSRSVQRPIQLDSEHAVELIQGVIANFALRPFLERTLEIADDEPLLAKYHRNAGVRRYAALSMIGRDLGRWAGSYPEFVFFCGDVSSFRQHYHGRFTTVISLAAPQLDDWPARRFERLSNLSSLLARNACLITREVFGPVDFTWHGYRQLLHGKGFSPRARCQLADGSYVIASSRASRVSSIRRA